MAVLTPGDTLRITRSTAGLGQDESLDLSVLPAGSAVKYIRPTWLLVELDNGERADVHIDSLERVDEKTAPIT